VIDMAENLIKEGWYPKTKLKSYSYAKKLEIDNPELYTEIKNLLAKSKDNLTKAQEPSTKRLEQLWKQERDKEI
jgi:hypothetical protein